METAENISQNLKRINQSNNHVQKIIQSAQKLINKDYLANQQKQKMELKISIENQHLTNILYKINTNQHTLKLQINEFDNTKITTPEKLNIQINKFDKGLSNSYNSYTINYEHSMKNSQQKEKQFRKKLLQQIKGQLQKQQPKKVQKKMYQNLSEKSFSKITAYSSGQKQYQKQFQEEGQKTKQKQIEQSNSKMVKTTPKKQYRVQDLDYTKGTILKKNTQKLQNLQKKKYTIHLDRLHKKRQEEQKRFNSKSNVKISQLSPNSKLYSPVLQYKSKKCDICRDRSALMKKTCKHQHQESQKTIKGFDLARKYLTQEGQKECLNFLKAKNVPQKDWDSYITQYVYRQLSKIYNTHQRQTLNNSRINKS